LETGLNLETALNLDGDAAAGTKHFMDLRLYIRGTLWAGGLLILSLAVAGALWLILATIGDEPGSQGAKGVAVVAIVGLIIDVLALNVLLALTELTRPPRLPRDPQDLPPT
jgi:hypothetical protein